MFTSATFFTGVDAVRGFAGEDYEQAVVEETARRALSRWDERSLTMRSRSTCCDAAG
jgi:hypothetical protein